MRFLLQALTLLLALPAAAGVRAEPDQAALVRLAASIWKIEVARAQGGYSLGTGVAVGPQEVLTNCHVTRDAAAVYLLRGGLRQRVESQAVDAEHDLCLLRLSGLDARAVALGRSSELGPGQTVTAFGYSGGIELQRSRGRVVALNALDGGRVIQSSNAFTSGASGGGLFDEQLQLVGILTFRLRGGSAHYFSAPIEWLQPLLAGGDNGFEPIHPLDPARLAYWRRAAATQPKFLVAAVLERENRWDELEALAFNWTRIDADDPQPWFLHGLALSSLHRLPESQRALERALQLEPSLQRAWFQLGLVHVEQGRLDRAERAQVRLEALRSDLAGELGSAIANAGAGATAAAASVPASR